MPHAIPTSIPSEFTEWVVYLMAEAGFMLPQLGAVLVVDGRLDHVRLERAVRLAMDAEPVLGSRFVDDERRPYWERVGSLEAFEALALSDTPDARSAALEYVGRPIEPCLGPQLSARLFRGVESDVLALRLSHVAVDGAAVKECAYLVADLYRRLDREPAFTPSPNLDGVRNVGTVAKRATPLDRLRAMRPADPFPATNWGFPRHSDERGRPVHLLRTIAAETFREVRAFGRDRGATVNDLVLAAYYRVLFDGLGPGAGAHTPVQLSCDLRPWLPAGTATAFANISSVWSVSMAVPHAERFEDTLERVVERTKAWKASDPALSTALSLSIAERFLGTRGFSRMRGQMLASLAKMTDTSGYPVLTNVGVLDDARLTLGDEAAVSEAFLLGPVAYPPGFVLTASSYRDELTLSSGIDRLALPAEMAELVLEGVAAELESLARPTTRAPGIALQ